MMDFDALAPVSRFSDGLVRRSSVAPQNPAEVLALLMDFSGSVALAELLQAPAPQGRPHPEAPQRARALQDVVRVRLDAALPFALRPLTGERAPKLPSAAALFDALARLTGGPGRVPNAEAVARLALEFGAPRRAALGASLRQAQTQCASLRWEIAHELQALGPHADRLERIDAALQRSLQTKLGGLFSRMEQAAELSFERACERACAALPAEFEASALASWAADGGWLERHRARCEQVAQAWFAHLRRNLEGLLLAVEAEVL
jgi:hypothetical protein